MHINQRKEQFSLAYVHTIATVAGFETYPTTVDHDSVDIGLRASSKFLSTAPHLEIQAKCTGGAPLNGTHLPFELTLKNYNDLRKDTLVPRILLVVLVPEDLDDWLLHDEERLSLHRCGYWLSLQGMPPTSNRTKISLQLPRSQIFDVTSLKEMMKKIHLGQPL